MRSRMRVAVLTTSYPSYPGDPAGHFVASAARALAHAGAEVHVVAPGGSVYAAPRCASDAGGGLWGTRPAAARSSGGRGDGAPAPGAVATGWSGRLRAWRAPAARRDRPRRSHRRALDGAVRVAARAARLGRAPRRRPRGGRAPPLRHARRCARPGGARAAGARAPCVVRVGAFAGGAAVRAPRPPCRGAARASTVELPPLRRRLERPADAPARCALRCGSLPVRGFAVVSARLVGRKRVEVAVDGGALPKRLPVVLVIGPERCHSSGAAAAAGRVRFLGTVAGDEALAWTAAADLLIHPSRTRRRRAWCARPACSTCPWSLARRGRCTLAAPIESARRRRRTPRRAARSREAAAGARRVRISRQRAAGRFVPGIDELALGAALAARARRRSRAARPALELPPCGSTAGITPPLPGAARQPVPRAPCHPAPHGVGRRRPGGPAVASLKSAPFPLRGAVIRVQYRCCRRMRTQVLLGGVRRWIAEQRHRTGCPRNGT